ncbi:hydrogenase formation protein HypD [Candidatus Haliotispira prima]|uniref:Hydrogenase formation protein HypD n=1 Tax=Candidatus Haliotispira prima TaxID=3034016 RepID=A0ABY8MI04_9SPIO|nr:hydrogenase formation protein HypD [Candidatus Haliotispira prima]
MKYSDDFRKPELVKNLCDAIGKIMGRIASAGTREKVRVMEFCGGHTHTLFKYGLEELLPKHSGLSIQMVHGPGCPVCVLPMSRVDQCAAIALQPDVILCSFGDALRIPGMHGNLLDAKARGADVRTVYSPLDALTIARKNPEQQVVFFALGFETTMPSTAFTVLEAEKQNIPNFSVFCNHILTSPTLRALLQDPTLELDGFVAPGHVAMVTGLDIFNFVSDEFHKPLVVSGFEPSDLLQGIYMVLLQIANGEAKIENQYTRVVKGNGSAPGLDAMTKVYMPHPILELRGFGQIGNAGVCLRPEYENFDAEKKFGHSESILKPQPTAQSQEAFRQLEELLQKSRCGEVLKGKIEPTGCPLYGELCTPHAPVGALMVSSEGSCAAYYNRGIRSRKDSLLAADA